MTTLIDDLLEEQQRLTAVDRFARQHERGGLPAQARYYQALIPLQRPQPGEQYAFAVDLDLCTGCKGCVSACHSLNGLDDDEIWRNVGLVHGGSTGEPYQQTVTTACHHCVEPGCLEGCPVMAYEKDEVTGIVRHLDDQCIGCQYCVLKCPYDVPKYSEKRGIVRKCDMCSQRLAADEAPACVQACPTSAIAIRIVSKEVVTSRSTPGSRLIPGAFDSSYTKPTTEYQTRKRMPANTRPADEHHFRLEHAHWPLIWMLLFTQWAAGLFVATAALSFLAPAVFSRVGATATAIAFLILNAGLGVSVLHLGRPLGAWRFFLGLRRSWMSREILGFSLFAGAAGAFTGALWWPALARSIPLSGRLEAWIDPLAWAPALGVLTSLLGLAGVWCSIMIYVDTRRPFWVKALTTPKFFGAAAVLGLAGLAAVLAWRGEPMRWPLAGSLLVFGWLSAWEAREVTAALGDPASPWHRSARLQLILAPERLLITGFAGAAGLVAISYASAAWSLAFLLLCFSALLLERYCYFTASHAPRMPGRAAS